MEKQLTKKIIFSSIIFSLVFSFAFSSIKTNAAALNWDNPANNGNPYKIQLTDTLNGQMLADVVSCTGIIDGTIKTVTSFASDQLKKLVIKKLVKAKEITCENLKASMITGLASAMNFTLTDVANVINCKKDNGVIGSAAATMGTTSGGTTNADGTLNPKIGSLEMTNSNQLANTKSGYSTKTSDSGIKNNPGSGDTKVSDPTTQDKLDEIAKQQAKDLKRRECLNGIATRLAKDQLAVMTKYTMNWVNSGFNGDPMYVRNIDSFMRNMSDDIVTRELHMYENQPQYFPYYNNYYRSRILGNIAINDFSGSMKQNITDYLDSGRLGSDTADYLSHGNYMNRYANDFSLGGWNGWLALTQREANNPLGFEMSMSQNIADKQKQQIENTKQELAQNQGILSQKKCVAKGATQGIADNKVTQQKEQAAIANALSLKNKLQGEMNTACKALATQVCTKDPKTGLNTVCKMVKAPGCDQATLAFQSAEDEYQTLYDFYAKKYKATDGADKGKEFADCTQWETVTPGSVILSKVNTYLNSEVRQLELADGVNAFLAGIFDSLVTTLRNEGLSSLSSLNSKGGNTYNKPILQIDPDTGDVMTSSGYASKSVDLTKDLGNTFVHETLLDFGKWDAENNTPKLSPNIGPYDPVSKTFASNVFYTVSKAGNSQIILEGYNGWEIGDRAYFDGTKWQNWKKDVIGKDGKIVKTNPIKKAGIVQIQKDYLVAAKEMLSISPTVMPALGELDYCIPGPNPAWQVNSGNASDRFMELTSELTTNYNTPGGFLGKRASVNIISPSQDAPTYNNYKQIFSGSSQSLWQLVTTSYPFATIVIAPKIQNEWKGKSWGGYSRTEEAISLVMDIKEKIGNDLELFKKGYETAIDSIYGPNSPMQREFIENEKDYTVKPNPAYLKISQEGLNITKDIVSYSEKVKELEDQYRSDMIDANTNIKKLELIKDQVSAIILAAQERRLKNRDAVITKYNKDKDPNDPAITIADYNSCIKEENVSFYEDTAIFSTLKGGAERCTDGIDNDLNGLIDSADPACQNFMVCEPGSTNPNCPNDNFDNIVPVLDTTIFEESTGTETMEVNQ